MFSPTSFWAQRLPAGAPIDPSSATFVSSLLAYGAATSYSFNYRDWSTAFFIAGPSTPMQKVTVDVPITGEYVDLQGMFEEVPIPSNLRPPGPWGETDGDHHTEIYSPFLDTLWGFWKLRQFEVDGPNTNKEVEKAVLEAPGWHARYGMGIRNVSQNVVGASYAGSWPGLKPHTLSTTASGLPTSPGIITVAEAQRAKAGIPGAIQHPLLFSAGNKEHLSSQSRWPALKTDGESSDPGAVQQGMIFRLPFNYNTSGIALPFVRGVCEAIRDFGMVCFLSSGNVAIRCECQATQAGSQAYGLDAWLGPENKVAGKEAIINSGSLATKIPWPDLQVVDPTYRPSGLVPGMLAVGK